MKNNLPYLLALHSVHGLGPIRLKNLLDYFEDPKVIWELNEKEILTRGIPQSVVSNLVNARKTLDPEKYVEGILKSGIKYLTIFDDKYPKLLKEIYDPPIVLYYLGDLLPADKNCLAIVGTRKISGYGTVITEKFATELSNAGLTIVSGLAHGVDTCAHKAVIKAKGRTLAILGGGLKNIFPSENISLAKNIADGFGAVMSEFAPSEQSLPGNFPARNRIISGLSQATLVTEAAENSGSLITAKLALDQGREVFAIPGPITSELSKGPSALIKQGARLVTEPSEILEELGIKGLKNLDLGTRSDIKLSEIEQKIYDALENENQHVDELCRNLKLSAAIISSSLVKLEIQGVVKNLGGGNYTKI
ncbi:MAG: DNA-processing protein DprA [Candidatus Daviesbacteria bacterium]|nr:DNA-processing protein DprA [Candidatus Daviesbacteria bacterium]